MRNERLLISPAFNIAKQIAILIPEGGDVNGLMYGLVAKRYTASEGPGLLSDRQISYCIIFLKSSWYFVIFLQHFYCHCFILCDTVS